MAYFTKWFFDSQSFRTSIRSDDVSIIRTHILMAIIVPSHFKGEYDTTVPNDKDQGFCK